MRHLCLLLVLTFPLVSQSLYNDTTIHELRMEFYHTAWKDSLVKHVASETDIPARLTVNGLVFDSIGVRYKGNSSYNIQSDKKPFNLSIDAYRENQLLYGYKTLNLNNFFKDPTCVREKIAYDIASAYFPAVKSAYVKLYINNEYWGLYLNVQQINKIFLREHFSAQGGNLYKGDPPGAGGVFGRADFTWHGSDTAYYRGGYQLKTNEEINDWSDLVQFINKLNNLPEAVFESEIRTYLNVDRALWYLAYCNLFVNLDSYLGSGHNYYLYDNPLDGMNIILWDVNEVLGTFTNEPLSIPQREALTLFYKNQDAARPLAKRLLGIPSFRRRYVAHVRTMLDEVFSETYWQPRIKKYQDLIATPLSADTRKLYTMSQFSANATANVLSTGPGPTGTIPGVLSFINNRRNYLLTLPDVISAVPSVTTLTHTLSQTGVRDSVTFTAGVQNAQSVTLWWSVNHERFQSQLMVRGVGDPLQWKLALPLFGGAGVVRYYVEAKNAADMISLYPPRAEYATAMFTFGSNASTNPVVINELMASNTKTIKDQQNEYDDWLELYNRSGDTVQIGGMYMSDEPKPQSKWRIPSPTPIPPKRHLLIWADEDVLDGGGLHANFKLSKSGEALFLWDTSGTVIVDSTSFGVQSDDKSWARVPDGDGTFRIVDPTPGISNGSATSAASLEILPASHALLQNYPNPFNPSTTIIYSLPARENVSLTVFNSLGQEVAVLVSEQKPAGSHRVVWHADVPSGIYFCRLLAGGYRKTTKMLVVR